MLLGGDEIGRTQGGNNNAWCQDNEISWFDWDSCDEDLLTFVRQLIELRRKHHVFRRTKFFEGKGEQLPDVWWMRPDGRKMTQRDWRNTDGHAIGVFLNGDELNMTTQSGEELEDESFLVLFNAHHEPLTFRLPTRRFGARWKLELSTAEPELEEGARSMAARASAPSSTAAPCRATSSTSWKETGPMPTVTTAMATFHSVEARPGKGPRPGPVSDPRTV
jgi:glycogen operon protein